MECIFGTLDDEKYWDEDMKKKIVLIMVLVIFLTGMLCACAAEPVDAKVIKKSKYVASKNSDKFHKKSCSYAKKIKAKNKITFKSKLQAKKLGYKPCKKCHP